MWYPYLKRYMSITVDCYLKHVHSIDDTTHSPWSETMNAQRSPLVSNSSPRYDSTSTNDSPLQARVRCQIKEDPFQDELSVKTRPRSASVWPVVAPGHQAGRHTPFSLAHAAVPQEVVAVHQRQFVEEQFHGALAPALLRTLALHPWNNHQPIYIQRMTQPRQQQLIPVTWHNSDSNILFQSHDTTPTATSYFSHMTQPNAAYSIYNAYRWTVLFLHFD